MAKRVVEQIDQQFVQQPVHAMDLRRLALGTQIDVVSKRTVEHGVDHGADQGIELDRHEIARAMRRWFCARKREQLIGRVRQTIHAALQASDAFLLSIVVGFIRQHFQLCFQARERRA